MLSVLDQENITASHATIAASKPLNHSTRSLQPKTPGLGASRTPSRFQNDENASFNTTKATKNAFITPAPWIERAPLGAKTTNAKLKACQTPAPKGLKDAPTTKKASTARRSVKKEIYVEPEPAFQEPDIDESIEPDSGFAPPPIIPLPDPPIDFSEIDQSYPELRPENFNRQFFHYYRSRNDENGFSISKDQKQEADTRSLERDLAHIERIP